MSKVFKTPIKPAVLISDPAGSEGDFYFNSVSKTLRFYDGTSWNDVASGANAAVSVLSDYPNNPSSGDLVYNTSDNRMAIYYENMWKRFAYYADAVTVDGGDASSVIFDVILDGGNSSSSIFVDNYYP